MAPANTFLRRGPGLLGMLCGAAGSTASAVPQQGGDNPPLPLTQSQSSTGSIAGIQKQSKATPSTSRAQWAGGERWTQLPAGSHGSGWAPGRQILPTAAGPAVSTSFPAPPSHHCPSKSNHPTLQGHCPALALSPPAVGQQQLKPSPLSSCRPESPSRGLRASKCTNHSQAKS